MRRVSCDGSRKPSSSRSCYRSRDSNQKHEPRRTRSFTKETANPADFEFASLREPSCPSWLKPSGLKASCPKLQIYTLQSSAAVPVDTQPHSLPLISA